MNLQTIAGGALALTQIITCVVLLVKPLRERIMGIEDMREGQRSLLRNQIVRIYYHNLHDKRLRQYEYENLVACYKAYKQLGGNSFVRHIFEEMQNWAIE